MKVIYITTEEVVERTTFNSIQVTSDYSLLKRLFETKNLAVDIETYVPLRLKGRIKSALSPHSANISLVAMKAKEREEIIVLDFLAYEREKKGGEQPAALSILKEILETREQLIAHSASMEAQFFKKHLGVQVYTWWCTRVAAQLIGNATGGTFQRNSGGCTLKALCFNYLNINLTGKGEEQISDWMPRPLSEEKVNYAAADVLHLHSLEDLMRPIICNPLPDYTYHSSPYKDWGLGMEEVMNLEMQYVTVEAEMKYNGLPYSHKLNSMFQDALYNKETKTGIVYDLGLGLARKFGYKTIINSYTHEVSVDDKVLRCLRSSQELLSKLSTHIIKLDNTESAMLTRLLELYSLVEQKEAAEAKGEEVESPYYSEDEEKAYKFIEDIDEASFSNQQEILQMICKFKKYSKQASMNLARFVDPVTKRLHPGYNSLGAKTGRTTSGSPPPNAQNISSRTDVKRTFTKHEIISMFNTLFKDSTSKNASDL